MSLRVPGDKSIAHRALILGGLAEGTSRVRNLPDGLDVASTRRAMAALGVLMHEEPGALVIVGSGNLLAQPTAAIDCGNSGTTMRLLAGVLASRSLAVTLDGDASLRSRPMRRVADPLAAFGATISLTPKGTAPMVILGTPKARGVDAFVKIPSAQVKSALLLAGLAATGRTALSGALATRDHTERLFAAFGICLGRRDGKLILDGPVVPRACDVDVPGDLSSAAFLLAAAAAAPGAAVTVDDVGLNPTRTGFLDVLRRFGAEVETTVTHEKPEPRGTIAVRGAALHAIDVTPAQVPELIDELLLVGVLGLFARGTTTVRGARELRVKESDRIERFAVAARALGAEVGTFDDGFAVKGPARLHGAAIATGGDHRVAMAFTVAARVAGIAVSLDDPHCVAVSFPGFADALERVA